MQVKQKGDITLHLSEWLLDKNLWKKKCWRGYWEKRTLVHYWWESKLRQLLCKTVWRYFKRQKKLPCNPAIPLLSMYSKNWKLIWKDMRSNRQEAQDLQMEEIGCKCQTFFTSQSAGGNKLVLYFSLSL